MLLNPARCTYEFILCVLYFLLSFYNFQIYPKRYLLFFCLKCEQHVSNSTARAVQDEKLWTSVGYDYIFRLECH